MSGRGGGGGRGLRNFFSSRASPEKADEWGWEGIPTLFASRASPEKADERGGGGGIRHSFLQVAQVRKKLVGGGGDSLPLFSDLNILGSIFQTQSTWPSYITNLSDKQKKKKKKKVHNVGDYVNRVLISINNQPTPARNRGGTFDIIFFLNFVLPKLLEWGRCIMTSIINITDLWADKQKKKSWGGGVIIPPPPPAPPWRRAWF